MEYTSKYNKFAKQIYSVTEIVKKFCYAATFEQNKGIFLSTLPRAGFNPILKFVVTLAFHC